MDEKLYRLYVDEVGSPNVSKKATRSDKISELYFGLCGILVSVEEYKKLVSGFKNLRHILCADVDEHSDIHFHRKEIVECSGYFSVLKNEEVKTRFNNELIRILKEVGFKIIFIGLDKYSHQSRYESPMNSYHYMMNILVEKYVYELERIDGRGDVMFECRGKTEDRQLQNEFEHFYEIGSNYCSGERVQRSVTSRNLKFKSKDKNISGLELADILAFVSLVNLLDENHLREISKTSFNYEILKIILTKFAYKGKKIIL